MDCLSVPVPILTPCLLTVLDSTPVLFKVYIFCVYVPYNHNKQHTPNPLSAPDSPCSITPVNDLFYSPLTYFSVLTPKSSASMLRVLF